jgi:predicted permease
METLIKDFRFAARSLAKRPGFTLIVVLTLAVGIGAKTARCSVFKAVLLRPLPYRDAERVVTLWQNNSKAGIPRNDVSPANFVDWSEQSNSFEAMAGIEPFSFSMIGDGEPERFSAWLVTSGFFQVAGTEPELGRTFSAEDYQPGNNRVVVLSHGVWQRRFGGDASVVGRKLTLNGQPAVVVGVMPQEFQLPPDREIWAPLVIGERQRQLRGATFWNVVARLKPGTTVAQAQEEMNGIAARLAAQYPDTNGGMGATVVPIFEQLTGQISSALWALAGAVGFVLLIACVNVANLLLVRGRARTSELSLRAALGASATRLARLILLESTLLAAAGGLAGLLLAAAGVRVMAALARQNVPLVDGAAFDPAVLLFTATVSLASAVVFGTIPAIQAVKGSPTRLMAQAGRSNTGSRRQARMRDTLVVAEVALSLILLVGAGLMIRSFARLTAVDPGFATTGVMTFTLSLPGAATRF